MNIRKPFIDPHAVTAFTMAVALTLPCIVGAVSLGEVVLQSGPGEPLLARVDLLAGSSEHIEDSCLSLAVPDSLREDAGSFLTEAKLSLKADGSRQYVSISSLKPFNDTSKLRLQVKCPGMQGVIKTLIVSPPAQTAGKKPADSASLIHELPAEPINESRIEKISAEEIALLLEQQKLLVVSFLAMQQQFKLLQDELREIKLQLAQPGVGPSGLASSATAGTQEGSPKPDIVVKQPVAQQDSMYLQNVLLAAIGLVLFILVLWLGLRNYTKTKSHNGTGSQQDPVQKVPVAPAIKQPSQLKSVHAPAAGLPPKAGAAGNAAVAHPVISPKKNGTKVAEEDAMLEEAGLYAANGRMDKAVEILREVIKRCPSKADAWTLLLSIYSALGRVAEFEITAREFLKHHKANPSWGGIQVLGRTLDHDNPLYADHGSHISASPLLPEALNLRHPIGDVLIEMGALSKREILKYLDDFDPQKHGRFGGYLVARKAITIAQLDQALLQQHGVHAEAKAGDLPSLQEIENFLASFDPKQHGSVAKFMASHNVTPEQLGQLLQQPSNRGAPAKKPQADDMPNFDKVSTP